jgi:porphyrinogen peroxidase
LTSKEFRIKIGSIQSSEEKHLKVSASPPSPSISSSTKQSGLRHRRVLVQAGILAEVPRQAGYLLLSREAGAQPPAVAKALKRLVAALKNLPEANKAGAAGMHVLGLSDLLARSLGRPIAGHRPFLALANAKVDLPVTQSDVLVWLRGSDQGDLFHDMRRLCASVHGVLKVDSFVQAFKHRKGNDLSGFEDGTENPKDDLALACALQEDGSSLLAQQRWEHHFARFDAMTPKARNHALGRDLSSNEELDDAPASAHVKRTAQESFVPEAFVLRRSMPWLEGHQAGLMFAAFARSFDAFEAQLKRMSGAEDGKIDGLFSFTRPLGGGYYWCPPVHADGAINLTTLKL